MNAFVLAATVLLAALAPLLVLVARSRPIDGLVALQVAATVAALALLCLSAGLGESFLFVLPIVSALVSWIGGLVFARFLGRWV